MAAADYDLVFANTHVVGGSFFDLLPLPGPQARIVLVTASEAHAIRAYEVGVIDYVLKPVSPARLKLSLSRHASAAGRDFGATSRPDAKAKHKFLAPEATLPLRCGQTTRFTPVSQISAITAHDNYSEVTLAGGNRAFLRRTLKSWEDMLPAGLFMRVHRTQIINLSRVVECRRDRAAGTLIEVEGLRRPVSASRRRWRELQLRLRLR